MLREKRNQVTKSGGKYSSNALRSDLIMNKIDKLLFLRLQKNLAKLLEKSSTEIVAGA